MNSLTAKSIANVAYSAYNEGLLNYEPMTICGITVTLRIETGMNTIIAVAGDVRHSVCLFDSHSIEMHQYLVEWLFSQFALTAE